MNFSNFKKSILCQIINCFIVLSFCVTSVVPPAYAQVAPTSVLNLPVPGTLVPASAAYMPMIIKGIKIHPDDPMQMNFIINAGDDTLDEFAFKNESDKLIKYFLASLTIPENELWVNLSPYEENRIVSKNFGSTQMGRDLLAQDYMLKQLTSSMMYPEDEVGKEFWKRVHKLAYEKFGTTDIPMNTFNKIWIVPEKAVVYEHDNNAVVVESNLKVMLEEDYLALDSHQSMVKHGQKVESADIITGASLDVVREVLIPEIQKEINHGKTFSQLRQIYNAVILANWYKQNLKESFLGQVYVDQGKTQGIESPDKEINQKIYEQYIQSFKKGVYNYIKEDIDPVTQQAIPRHYFSGGADFAQLSTDAVASESGLTARQRANLNQSRNTDVEVDFAMAKDSSDEADSGRVKIQPMNPLGAEIRPGSSAQMYADQVVKAKWYQANLAFDLDPVVARVSESGNDVVLDASAGTGGASLYILDQLRAKGKRIKKLVLADVEYGQSIGFMKHAQATILNQYKDVVDEVEFYILPKLGQDVAGADQFALVSDIPGLKADHIVMENAIHLIPKSQLVAVLKSLRDVMRTEDAVLTMGTGDIAGIEYPDASHIGIHDMFDIVGDEAARIIESNDLYESLRPIYLANRADETIQARKQAAFPAASSLKEIQDALVAAGFNTSRVYNNQDLTLEREDYKPFITGISGYVKSRLIPELTVNRGSSKDVYGAMRNRIVNQAYSNAYDNAVEGYNLYWTKIEVSAADSAMAGTELEEDQRARALEQEFVDEIDARVGSQINGLLEYLSGRYGDPVDIITSVVGSSIEMPLRVVTHPNAQGEMERQRLSASGNAILPSVPSNINTTFAGVMTHGDTKTKFIELSVIVDTDKNVDPTYLAERIARDQKSIGIDVSEVTESSSLKGNGELTLDPTSISTIKTPFGTQITMQIWFEDDNLVGERPSVTDGKYRVLEGSLMEKSKIEHEPLDRTINVMINGAGGATGATQLRHYLRHVDPTQVKLVAVNGANIDRLISVIERDSTHGPFLKDGETLGKERDALGDVLVARINGFEHKIHVFNRRGDITGSAENQRETAVEAITGLPLTKLGIDVVFDSSDKFKSHEGLSLWQKAGAKWAVLTAPSKKDIHGESKVQDSILMGVNEDGLPIVLENTCDGASCTTNNVVPVLHSIMNGAREGMAAWKVHSNHLLTVHAKTGSQALLDNGNRQGKSGAASEQSMIPASTGAGRATVPILPELEGKLSTSALRVNVPDGSFTFFTGIVEVPEGVELTPELFNDRFKSDATSGSLGAVLTTDSELMSSMQGLGRSESSTILEQTTKINQIAPGVYRYRTVSFYDNEWGYSGRMTDIAHVVGKKIIEAEKDAAMAAAMDQLIPGLEQANYKSVDGDSNVWELEGDHFTSRVQLTNDGRISFSRVYAIDDSNATYDSRVVFDTDGMQVDLGVPSFDQFFDTKNGKSFNFEGDNPLVRVEYDATNDVLIAVVDPVMEAAWQSEGVSAAYSGESRLKRLPIKLVAADDAMASDQTRIAQAVTDLKLLLKTLQQRNEGYSGYTQIQDAIAAGGLKTRAAVRAFVDTIKTGLADRAQPSVLERLGSIREQMADSAMAAKKDISELRNANLAKKVGLIPHRDIEEEEDRFFSVNRWIKQAYDANQTQVLDRAEQIKSLASDDWVQQSLRDNNINTEEFLALVDQIEFVGVEDLKNGSPALVMRSASQYQVAHVGVEAKKVYVGQGTIDALLEEDARLLDGLLMREALALYITQQNLNESGENYNEAVEAAEAVAEQFEKDTFKDQLDRSVQKAVDAFLDQYYVDLLEKNVIWDYESSVFDEERGKELVGGKTYQQGLYWSEDPNNNLRSFGASTTASTRFLKAYDDLIPQIDAILNNLDVADDIARVRAEADIRALIVSYDVPEDIDRDLRAAYTELERITKQSLVAIRSSGKAEDNSYEFKVLTDVNVGSNAGQHDSYLGESGEDAMVRRWKDDISSLYTEQVMKYRDTLMVITAFDEILSDSETAEVIIETLEASSNSNDLLVAKALRNRDFNIVTSIKLRNALSSHDFDAQVEIVNRHRQTLLNVDNIAMGVTVMPMAGVDISFVIMGHDISADWTAMGFQDIPEEEYANKGRVATITTNYGIGESIVQGVTTPDSYLVHIFEDENGSHVNILSRQLGTKTVQAVYTNPVLEQLNLKESDVDAYLALIEDSDVLPAVGIKSGSDVSEVRNVLTRLIKLTVDKTIEEITDEDLTNFDYDKDDLKLLVHLLKELEEDRDMKTMFTDVSEDKRNSFSAADSQVVEIAKEFMKKAKGYGHMVDMEGAVGLNLGRENTPVTVQRRPSNVEGDIDKPNLIQISYTFVSEKDLAEVLAEENPVENGDGEDSGLVQGELVAQGIATRNSFSGKIYKIDEERGLASQFEEIKKLAERGEQIIIRTRETTPDYNAVLQADNVMGVIADVGGATSHAAVMSRELGIATVVGIQSWVNKLEASVGEEQASKILNYINTSGNIVTVDANANEKTGFGAVYAGELPISERDIEIDLERLPEVYTRIGYIMGMPHPMLAMSKISRYSGYSGVALMRGEFAYAEENINPRFGRAYDNFLIATYLRTVKDNPPARNYLASLTDAEREALDQFKMHLARRNSDREKGIEITLDATTLKIQEYQDAGYKAFLNSLDEYSRADVEAIREHPEQIAAATKQMLGYLSYNSFFEAVHGGAIASMAAANNVDKNAVLYRSIDFKKNEARELIGSEVFDPIPEVSTMIGERGARWLLQPENQIILREEIRMILRETVRGYSNIGFFFPFVSTPNELDELMQILIEEERAMSKQLERPVYLREVGQMTELPSNVIQGDQFIKVLKDHEADQVAWFKEQFGADIKRKSFLSFGTNDLTQLTLGADRDNPDMSYLFSEAHPFVIESIRHVVNIAVEMETKCGLCGQALVNLVNINPEAAEAILMMLGQTGGYAGTDYLGTLASITRAASATLKHGVVDAPVKSTDTAGEYAENGTFTSNVKKGAATRPVYSVNTMSELGNSYVGDYVVLRGNLDFDIKEETVTVDGEEVVQYTIVDETIREQMGRLGAVIYGVVEHFDNNAKYVKAIEQLGVPVVLTQVKVAERINRRTEDGDLLTIDFNNGVIYRDKQDVRVDVPGLASEIELSEEETPTEPIQFDDNFRVSKFYQDLGVHPLSFLDTKANIDILKQSLRRSILTQLDGESTRLVYETLDLQSDDLVELRDHEGFLEEQEVNPALGFAGMDAIVNDSQWKKLFSIELEVLAELMDEGHNIYIQFNSVKVPETVEVALQMVTDAGIEIDSQIGMNTAWPGNYLALEQYLDQGLSFITLDERRLAQGYLSADLFKNQSVIRSYTAEKVVPNLRRPIAMITRAAADRNVSVNRIGFDESLARVDAAMAAIPVLQADAGFLSLIDEARTADGQGEMIGAIKGKGFWANQGFVEANREEIRGKIKAAIDSLISRGQIRDTTLRTGFAASTLREIGYNEDEALFIAALGRYLNFWKVFPDDTERDQELIESTYRSDTSGLNVPKIDQIDLQALGYDQAMSANTKDLGGIDLDPNLFEIERKGDGSLIFPKFKGSVGDLNIQGIVPVIINVTPINSLPLLLGLADTAEDESNDISYDSLDPIDRKARLESDTSNQLSFARN